jgi:hypothetical protein
MKGLWKNKLSGYNAKGEKRKSQNFNKYVLDNAVYNLTNNKYVEDKDDYYLNNKLIRSDIAYRKLDDFNKRAQFEANNVDRCVRCRVREYISRGDWEAEVKPVYGEKSIAWLVS